MKNILIKILSIICFLIIFVLIIFLLFIIITKALENNNKTSHNLFNSYTIVGESMKPYLRAGDIIITKKNKNNIYKINDVITFNYSDDYYNNIVITHRIVEIKQENNLIYYITKGDNNKFKDKIFIEKNSVFGKIFIKLSKLQYIKEFILKPPLWAIIVLIPCLFFVVYNILKVFNEKKIKRDQVFE